MRFAFCNEGFGGRSWSEVCKAISEAGYDGVEIAPFTMAEDVRLVSAARRAEVRETAERAGLEIVGLHWLLVKPEGLHISHPDESVRARTADYFRYLAHFCADLGGKVMVFGSPRQRGQVEGVRVEQAWEWAAATFRSVLPTLAERRVTLCIEPLTPAETNWVNTAEEGRRLVEALDHPNFRLILDVKAMASESRPIPELVKVNRDIVAHVHANDANRQALWKRGLRTDPRGTDGDRVPGLCVGGAVRVPPRRGHGGAPIPLVSKESLASRIET